MTTLILLTPERNRPVCFACQLRTGQFALGRAREVAGVLGASSFAVGPGLSFMDLMGLAVYAGWWHVPCAPAMMS